MPIVFNNVVVVVTQHWYKGHMYKALEQAAWVGSGTAARCGVAVGPAANPAGRQW